jgi:hypothetical protein
MVQLYMIGPIGGGPVDPGYFPQCRAGGPSVEHLGAHPSHPIYRPDLGIWGPVRSARRWAPQPPLGIWGRSIRSAEDLGWAGLAAAATDPTAAAGGGYPVDPGYGIDMAPGRFTHPIYIPPQVPTGPVDGKVHLVIHADQNMPGGYERITFWLKFRSRRRQPKLHQV